MTEHIFTFEPGSDEVAPLFVFVHGRAGTVGVMNGFSRSIPVGMARLFIQAPIPDPIGGFSWWLVDDASADPWRASYLLDDILSSVLTKLGIKPRCMIALGFSQGGAVLAMALQRNPALFSGLAMLASFVIRSPIPVPLGGTPDIFIAHGEHDEVVSLAAAEEGAQYLSGLGWPTTMVVDSVGHKVGVQGIRGLREWATRVARDGIIREQNWLSFV
jgi:phospholipase/carboxylesterase